jgi:type II secretory pathway component PulK
MALLVVLLLTMIIVPFAAEFAYQISLETMTADNVTAQLKIDNAIESQYEAFLARLRYDTPGNQSDSYDDDWNAEELRSRTDPQSDVRLEMRVFDEQGKLNIRMLGQGTEAEKQLWRARFVSVFQRFREGTRFDVGGYAEELVDALYRWVNNDATRGELPKPRTHDDSPLLTLDDLAFVHDRFGKDLLLVDRRAGDEVGLGLHHFVTVHGTGQVNLNTAHRVVLEAFFPIDRDVAQRIVERREGQSEDAPPEPRPPGEPVGGPGSGTPFTDVMEVNELEGVTPNLLRGNNVDLQRDFTVKSDFFSVRIAGEGENARREELFVVQRVQGQDPQKGPEGFRHLLHQERTDPLEEELPEEP